MQNVLPAGRVFQAGTLSGNPVATAAGIATLECLRDEAPYDELERRSRQLADGLLASVQRYGIQAQLNRVGSMMTLFFTDTPVKNWSTASRSDTKKFAKFFWGLMDRGVYWPCSQFEALFVSATHDESIIERTLQAADETLRELSGD